MIPSQAAHRRDLVRDCQFVIDELDAQLNRRTFGAAKSATITDPLWLKSLMRDVIAHVEASRRRP